MLYGGVLAEATDVVFAIGFVHKFFVRAISSRGENSTGLLRYKWRHAQVTEIVKAAKNRSLDVSAKP